MSYSVVPPDEKSPSNSAGVNPVKLEQLMREIKLNQSLPLGILGGLIASIIAAIIWAVISYVTNFQIGFMAIGVGFLVGYAVKIFGKGIDGIFGIVGAVFSLLGCLLGNFLTAVIAVSRMEGSSFLSVLNAFITAPEIIVELMKVTFSPIDLLFYAIALYQGYVISFRQLSEEEIASVQKTQAQP